MSKLAVMLPRPALLALLIAGGSLLPEAASADDWYEPQALGMAGAVRILGGDTSTVRLNPAAMVSEAVYQSGTSYSYNPREAGHRFSIGVADSRTSAFAIGSNYSIDGWEPPLVPEEDLRWFVPDRVEDLEDRRTDHRWDFAFAYGFLKRKLNLGVSARVIRRDRTHVESITRFTMDAGFNVFLLEFLGLGISVQNFIPTELDRFPIRMSPGVALKLGDVFRLGVDVVFDFTSDPDQHLIDMHAGAELKPFKAFAVRGGWYSDQRFADHFATWGVGVIINQLEINFGMQIEAGEQDKRPRADIEESANRIQFAVGIEMSM